MLQYDPLGVHPRDTIFRFRERPTGLIQHVLTVVVLGATDAWLPSFVQEPQTVSVDRHLFHGPFEQILGSAAPSSPATHEDTGCSAQDFATQGETHADRCPSLRCPTWVIPRIVRSKWAGLGAQRETPAAPQTMSNVCQHCPIVSYEVPSGKRFWGGSHRGGGHSFQRTHDRRMHDSGASGHNKALRCLESQFMVRCWNRTIRIARPKTVRIAVKALLFAL